MTADKKMTMDEAAAKGLLSMDIAEEKRQQLKQLFPEVFTEDKIDFDQFRRVMGDWVEPGKERYGLSWPGKAECMKVIQAPSVATLKPVREESVDFDNTENLFIEGDNLEVLKLLQKSYFDQIKVIYIDPPYNTGKEFIYPDRYQESLDTYLAYTGQADDVGRKFATNTEAGGRFHANWLNMMYPRLYLARNLLRDDGVIFISIDDNEYANLRCLCDQVFGEENFVSSFIWDGGRKNDSKKVSVSHEYIVCYTKSSEQTNEDETLWRERKSGIEDIYKCYEDALKELGHDWEKVSARLQKFYSNLPEDAPAKKHKHYRFADERGVYFASDLSGPDDGRKNRPRYQVLHPVTHKPVPIPSRGWRWEEPRMIEEIKQNRVHFGVDETSIPNGKVYLKENEYQAPSSVFYKDRRSASASLKSLFNEKVFDFPKDVQVLKRLISLVCRQGDIVLDFFAGSASTGEAVFELARETDRKLRFILVQLPEPLEQGSRPYNLGYRTIGDIARARLRLLAAKYQLEQSSELDLSGCSDRDFGYKALYLDKSNFAIWSTGADAAQELEEQLDLHAEHIDPASSAEQLLYELLLKSGFDLTTKVEKRAMAGKDVYAIADGALLICLDKEITSELIDAIADAEPLQVICLDEGFRGNDQLKANAVQTFRSRSKEDEDAIVFRTI